MEEEMSGRSFNITSSAFVDTLLFIRPWDTTESSGEEAHCLLNLGTLLRAVEKMPTVYYTWGHY